MDAAVMEKGACSLAHHPSSPNQNQLDRKKGSIKNTVTRHKSATGSSGLLRNLSRKRAMSQQPHGSIRISNKMADRYHIDDSSILLQESVQLATSLQTRHRYLLLLNDVLLLVKQKSSTSFHVKKEIRISEIWLADCFDKVAEIACDFERSFVIGWPVINMVATFRTTELKDEWLNKLQEKISAEKSQEWPRTTVIKITNRSQTFSVTRSVLVENSDEAKDVLARCVHDMHIATCVMDNYQLWVQVDKESRPFPLIGHERPYDIQMNYVREKQGTVGTSVTSDVCFYEGLKFQIILKRSKPRLQQKYSLDETRSAPKTKSHLVRFFKRPSKSVEEARNIFGRDLNGLFDHGLFCAPVMDMFAHIFIHGPFTVDIFRKSAIVSKCQEVKMRLDDGHPIDFNDFHVFVTAALLKEFLRCLPNCLLLSELYAKWIKVSSIIEKHHFANHRIRSLIQSLPSSHQAFLRYLVCILYHISAHSDYNGMTALSLSICIGHCLLWPCPSSHGSTNHQVHDAKNLNVVIERMIVAAAEIFGADSMHLFDHLMPQWKTTELKDSGTDSVSIHSSAEENADRLLNDAERNLDSRPSSSTPQLGNVSSSYDSGLTSSNPLLYDDDAVATNASVDLSPLRLSVATKAAAVCSGNEEQNRTKLRGLSDWFHLSFEDDLFSQTHLDKGAGNVASDKICRSRPDSTKFVYASDEMTSDEKVVESNDDDENVVGLSRNPTSLPFEENNDVDAANAAAMSSTFEREKLFNCSTEVSKIMSRRNERIARNLKEEAATDGSEISTASKRDTEADVNLRGSNVNKERSFVTRLSSASVADRSISDDGDRSYVESVAAASTASFCIKPCISFDETPYSRLAAATNSDNLDSVSARRFIKKSHTIAETSSDGISAKVGQRIQKNQKENSDEILNKSNPALRRVQTTMYEHLSLSNSANSAPSHGSGLNLKRGMTKHGSDLFPSRFLENFHHKIEEVALSEEERRPQQLLRTRSPIAKNLPVESDSQSEKRTLCSSNWKLGRCVNASQQHPIVSDVNNNQVRVRPTRPPSYDEAVKQKAQQSVNFRHSATFTSHLERDRTQSRSISTNDIMLRSRVQNRSQDSQSAVPQEKTTIFKNEAVNSIIPRVTTVPERTLLPKTDEVDEESNKDDEPCTRSCHQPCQRLTVSMDWQDEMAEAVVNDRDNRCSVGGKFDPRARRRTRKHGHRSSDPNERTQRTVSLGRSKSDSSDVLKEFGRGERAKDGREENKENDVLFPRLSSLLSKRKQETMTQMSKLQKMSRRPPLVATRSEISDSSETERARDDDDGREIFCSTEEWKKRTSFGRSERHRELIRLYSSPEFVTEKKSDEQMTDLRSDTMLARRDDFGTPRRRLLRQHPVNDITPSSAHPTGKSKSFSAFDSSRKEFRSTSAVQTSSRFRDNEDVKQRSSETSSSSEEFQRLSYLFRAAQKNTTSEPLRINWSVSRLKQMYSKNDGGDVPRKKNSSNDS